MNYKSNTDFIFKNGWSFLRLVYWKCYHLYCLSSFFHPRSNPLNHAISGRESSCEISERYPPCLQLNPLKIYPTDRRKTTNINYLSILIHFYCTDLAALNTFSCQGGFKKISCCRFIKIFSLHTLRITDKNEIIKR